LTSVYWGECGHRVTMKGVKRCRPCRNEFYGPNHCRDCGAEINRANERCRACYDKARGQKPLCVDCGQPTKQYASEYFAQRCWPCENKRRRSQPVRICTVEGCERVHQAKGLCRNHYNQTLQRRRAPSGRTVLINWLKDLPCQLCGYSKMKSEAARLVPGGPYRPGNVMALCVRCHREVDAGLTPPPTPLTAEEITASRV
jgi:hypothetical protein